jgi:hypothetical protein
LPYTFNYWMRMAALHRDCHRGCISAWIYGRRCAHPSWVDPTPIGQRLEARRPPRSVSLPPCFVLRIKSFEKVQQDSQKKYRLDHRSEITASWRHFHEISNSNSDFQTYPEYIFLVPEATLITSILSKNRVSLAWERKLLKSQLIIETHQCYQLQLFQSDAPIIETVVGGNWLGQRAWPAMKGGSGRIDKVVMSEDFYRCE